MDTVARPGTTRPIRKITSADGTRITDNLFVAPALLPSNARPLNYASEHAREPGFEDRGNIIKAVQREMKKAAVRTCFFAKEEYDAKCNKPHISEYSASRLTSSD